MELEISDFMMGTCRVRPQPNINKFHALYYVICTANGYINEQLLNDIVTPSGSMSEFFIEPLLSCIDDVDIMSHHNNWLAVPEGQPVPRCLPEEFAREVELFEFKETDFPGYVLAKPSCKLIKYRNSNEYACVSNEHSCQFCQVTTEVAVVGSKFGYNKHGPAVCLTEMFPASRCFSGDDNGSRFRSVDRVTCIRCFDWPPQAAEWKTRRREYNWPDVATIDSVVSNGCDIVQIAHPWCEKNEWLSKNQWRLSFSRAETTLLNTWSPKQQLVYHMLRVFVSTFQSYHGISVVKRYHIKTLLMWTFELYSWDDDCVIRSCTRLLRELAKWLLSTEFPMYFVRKCNLFDNIWCVAAPDFNFFVDTLSNSTDDDLAGWFLDNYIRRWAAQYSNVASSLSVSSLPEVKRTLTEVSSELDSYFIAIQFDDYERIHFDLQKLVRLYGIGLSLYFKSNRVFVEQLQSIDWRFTDFYCALLMLRCASIMERGHYISSIIADRPGMLSALSKLGIADLSCYTELSASTSLSDSCNYFQVATSLMKTLRVTNDVKLIMEFVKVFLHASLQCDCAGDSHKLSNCASKVYMACLYYNSKQYRTALEYCVSAISSVQSSNIVNCIDSRLLPQFDDNSNRVLGVCSLYQFVHTSLLKQEQQAACNTFYSTDLLAHYLAVSCLKKQQAKRNFFPQNEFNVLYKKCLLDSGSTTVADILLFHLHQVINRQMNKSQIYSMSYEYKLAARRSLTPFNSTRLRHLLIETSVEYLNSFREIMSHQYSSVCTFVTRDFEAMYAYKCGLYEKCLQLSDDNVNFLLCDSISASVFNESESDLLMLMDDDFMSLIGLARLCRVFDPDTKRYDIVDQRTLSMYLLVQSKLRLRHSVKSMIDILSNISRLHRACCPRCHTKRDMMAFVYRKTVLHLKHRRHMQQTIR